MSGFSMSLAVAIGVYLFMAAAMFGCQRSFMYFPQHDLPDVSTAGVPGLEAVKLDSEPGLELVHWYRPPKGPEGPVVVIFHGNAGHIGHRVPKFRALLDAGFGVLFAEYRGYGGNPGSPDEPGLMADARSVMVYLDSQGIAPQRLVLYGESLGATVTVKMSVEWPVAAVVLEAPYTSLADVAQSHYWYLPARWLILDKWNLVQSIGRLSAPLLILHGERDRVIPVRFGRRVFEAAPGPKEALFHPRAGHNDLFAYSEVIERLIAFVRAQVPVREAEAPAAQGAAD